MSQAAVAAVSAPPLWRNLSFHVLWVCTFAAGMGDRLIMSAALPMLGYGPESHDNASIQAGIQFFFFLPYLLWSPFAGWLADRVPRKWLLLASDEVRGVIVLYAFFILPAGTSLVPPDHQWKVWAVICSVGVMAATFVPAKLSVVPSVVGSELLGRANAAVVSMGIIGNLLGLLVGGAIFKSMPEQPDLALRVMLFASAMCYIVSGFFWFFMRTPWKPRTPDEARAHSGGPVAVVRDIAQGIRYAWTHKPVRVLIITNAIVWGGVAIYMPALAVVTVELYGMKAEGFMFVAAPVGLGMLLASATLGLLNPKRGAEVLIALGLLICGVFIGLQMVVPVFGLGVAIALMTGIGAGTIFVPLYTLLQRATADHIRGRVFAAKEIVGELGQVVFSLIIWRMKDYADPRMIPATKAMALLLVVLALYGFTRYVLTGPIHSKLLNALWRFSRLYADAVHKVKVIGKHRVPRTGAVLLVSNHTAGVDPTLIQCGIQRPVRWMMAKEYMLPGLGWFWRRYRPIPVDRKVADSSAARGAVEALKAGDIVGLFPEGHINDSREGLLPLGPGVSLIARRTDAVIIPVHISGTPRTKHPLAAFFVPSRSRVVFGKPFRVPEEVKGREQVVAMIREKMEDVSRPMTNEGDGLP